jgi:hypothetical protein
MSPASGSTGGGSRHWALGLLDAASDIEASEGGQRWRRLSRGWCRRSFGGGGGSSGAASATGGAEGAELPRRGEAEAGAGHVVDDGDGASRGDDGAEEKRSVSAR